VTGPVLVTGAGGQLGTAIVRTFADVAVVAPSHEALDITDLEAVARCVRSEHPAVIINCAAWNDVDGAEDAPLDALSANAFALRSLARVAQDTRAVLVHYGSDFVFDGTAVVPYTETDRENPRSVYAASKLLGDWFALECPGAFVLRVESLFGASADAPARRRGTLDKMIDALRRGDEVPVFVDRTVSPSHVDDVARATRALLERRAAPGLYHCVNSGRATWQEVALEAARLLGVEPRLRLLTLEQATLKAQRPRFCALSNAKLASAGIAMPPWYEALAHTIAAPVRRSGVGA